jgi:hypothetical protein
MTNCPPTLMASGGQFNSRGRTRTCDPLINSQLLYQLSYTGSTQVRRLDRRFPGLQSSRGGAVTVKERQPPFPASRLR